MIERERSGNRRRPSYRSHGRGQPPPPRDGGRLEATLASLLAIASRLVAVLDPDELRGGLLDYIAEALPFARGGVLWLYDRSAGRLRVAAARMPTDELTHHGLMTAQLRPGEALAGLTLQRGEAQIAVTSGGYHEVARGLSPGNAVLFQEIGDQLPARVVSACLPLRAGGELSGVLELIDLAVDQPGHRPLAREDLPILQVFANLVAGALRNAQIYAQAGAYQQRLKAFDAVVTAISTATDLDDLMRSVLDVVAAIVPGAQGALLLLDRARERLTLGAAHGLEAASVAALQSLPLVGSPCEEVVHYGQPVFRPLLAERGEAELIAAGLESGAYLPLLAGGTVAGVLMLLGGPELYRSVEPATMMPICNQVGFAIANVRLYLESQSERRRLTTLINSITEGVILCDSQGQLMLYNSAAQLILDQEYIPFGQPLAAMPAFYGFRDLQGEPTPVEALPMARALRGEIFHDYRLAAHGASGDETIMSFSGAPAYADDGSVEGAVVVFRDVTAVQRVERAKDEFLAVAAHELRSPLAAVRSYADLLLRREQQRTEADPRDLHGLTILTQQVQHMLRMVDNLLDVSRLDAGQLDLQLMRVNLAALAAQVIDQQRPAAGTRELWLDAEPDELWAECDPLRIRQVITNLLGNAIKYSPPDTRITVRVRPLDGPPPQALISVSDEGAGLSDEQQDRLFQRFYRARSYRAEGLGLGLYLSRRFVQMHGGRIWVESAEGTGSTFAFTLPLGEI